MDFGVRGFSNMANVLLQGVAGHLDATHISRMRQVCSGWQITRAAWTRVKTDMLLVLDQFAVLSSVRSLYYTMYTYDIDDAKILARMSNLESLVVVLRCFPANLQLPAQTKSLSLHLDSNTILHDLVLSGNRVWRPIGLEQLDSIEIWQNLAWLSRSEQDLVETASQQLVAGLLAQCVDLKRVVLGGVREINPPAESDRLRAEVLTSLTRHPNLNWLQLNCDRKDKPLPLLKANSLQVILSQDGCRADLLKYVTCTNLQVDFRGNPAELPVLVPEGVETFKITTAQWGDGDKNKQLSLDALTCSTLRCLDVSQTCIDPLCITALGRCSQLEQVTFSALEASGCWRAWLALGLKRLDVVNVTRAGRTQSLEELCGNGNGPGSLDVKSLAESSVQTVTLIVPGRLDEEKWTRIGAHWLQGLGRKQVLVRSRTSVFKIWPQ